MFARIARTGIRRGITQGSRPWLVLGLVAGGVHLVQMVTRSRPQTVFEGRLAPGEGVIVRVVPPDRH